MKKGIRYFDLPLLLLLGCCWGCGKNHPPIKPNQQTPQPFTANEQPQNKAVDAEKTKQLMQLVKELEKGIDDLGLEEEIKSLIENGADVNAQDKTNKTPLCFAILAEKPTVVETLLENGASTKKWSDGNGNTALALATCLKQAEIVKLLLKHKADINEKSYGKTLLGIAVERKDPEPKIVDLLISHGADVNERVDEKDIHSRKPLITALRCCNSNCNETNETVDLLLSKDIDATKEKEDAYDAPIKDIIQFRRDDLHKAVGKLLKEKHINVNSKCGVHGNILNYAILRELPNIVKVLLKKGANVYQESHHGKDAFRIAIRHNQTTEILKLLLSCGNFDIKTRYNGNKTPLHLAVNNTKAEFIQLLLDKGADVHATDNDGDTPLTIASKKRGPDIVQLLQNHNSAN